jgi:hypothetical protein
MKGAIAFGKMTADVDNSLFFGQPLIDAFELQNELQLYDVILHHTVEKRINEPDMLKNLEKYDVFKYSVPMKTGKITHYIVDWTPFFVEETDPVDLVTKLYSNVSGTPRFYVDNTLEFVRWISARKQNLNKKES